MTVWIVLSAIVLVLFLLTRIRLRGRADYSASGFTAVLLLGKIPLARYPVPPKEKKKEKAPKKPTQEQEKKGGGLDEVKAYLPLVADAAGGLRRKIRIDRLDIDFTAAASDAAAAALAYGYANVTLGMIWPLFEQNFRIKEHRIRTKVDFEAKTPAITLHTALSLNMGQAVSLAARLGIRFLKISWSNRKKAAQQQQKEAS